MGVTQRALLLLLVAACATSAAGARQEDIPLGTWTGSAVFRGQPLPVSVRFEREGGALHGTFSAPAIALLEVPLRNVALDSVVRFDLVDGDGNIVFRGHRVADTLSGVGTLSTGAAARQGAPTMTWRLVRSASPAAAPYTTREVAIPARGATLAGTLFMPAGASAPRPAVLILQGSSTNLRSDYRFYADRFARAGFVVLTFDKRGNGESTGDYRRASYDDLVLDARAAAGLLAAQPGVDPSRLGLWGLSQGAFIAPWVAEGMRPAPVFIVAVSGPGVSIAETAAYQDSLRVIASGLHAAAAAEAASAHRALASALRIGATHDRIAALFARFAGARWRPVSGIPATMPSEPELGGWYWFGRTLDPVTWWRRMKVPALLVYGDADELVPAGRSAHRLAGTLRAAGRRDATVRMYPGANHVIRRVPDTRAAWEWPIVVPGYIEETIAWMQAHARR
jgi:dienelactone hydrolase